MLTAKGCSETALFREWSNKVLTICNLEKTLAITFFRKCLKFDGDSRNGTKNSEKVVRF